MSFSVGIILAANPHHGQGRMTREDSRDGVKLCRCGTNASKQFAHVDFTVSRSTHKQSRDSAGRADGSRGLTPRSEGDTTMRFMMLLPAPVQALEECAVPTVEIVTA